MKEITRLSVFESPSDSPFTNIIRIDLEPTLALFVSSFEVFVVFSFAFPSLLFFCQHNTFFSQFFSFLPEELIGLNIVYCCSRIFLLCSLLSSFGQKFDITSGLLSWEKKSVVQQIEKIYRICVGVFSSS